MKIELTPLNDQRTELWRWDTDRQIDIILEAGETANEAHFGNVFFNKALVVPIKVSGNTARADIPNILLQASQLVNVYVTAYSANGERTMHSAKFYVQNRPKPSDYVYTETEIRQYEQLKERINELEDKQITEDNLKDAVNEYLLENPVEIKVDKALSEKSENPVENKAVTKKNSEVEQKIPTDYVSNAELDKKGYLTQHQDLSGYAKKATTLEGYGITDGAKKADIPTAPEAVGAEPKGTADTKVSEHNISDTAHNDIRLLVKNLTDKITALLDSDDETLDQTSEIVAYIKSNKSLIDAITTSKVSVADIVDNLTTNLANKPLSAKQGLTLKGLIDDVQTALNKIVIPTKLPNPNKLTFSGAVSAEYDGSGAVKVTIPGADTVREEKTEADTEVELEPNKLYVFPEMASLSVTLQAPQNTGITNEYHFVFKSGATATTLTLPEDIALPDGFTVDANKIYEISILENMMLAQSWAVS